jgi:hypothetical protein
MPVRDCYLHSISAFQLYQLIFVDEPDCDKRAGFRRTGWSPLGMTPVQITKFQRDKCYPMIPVYAQDRIVLRRAFKGSTDADVSEDFIEQLLQYCNRWPHPNTVLIMDNASLHRTDRI